MRPNVIPLPAIAAAAGPFRVTCAAADDGASCLPPIGREPGLLSVPMDTSIQALATRMHEYGHLGLARIGAVPEDTLRKLRRARIHPGWVQFSLDVVVNAFMKEKGNTEIALLEFWTGTLPVEVPRWLAAMEFLRCEGLTHELRTRMSLQARAQFSLHEIGLLCSSAQFLRERGARARLLPVAELGKLLRKLQRIFGPDSMDETHPLLQTPCLTISGSPRRPFRRGANASDNAWGTMSVVALPLDQCCLPQRGALSRKATASYCGSFRFPHRALFPASDGRPFGLRRNVNGGSVLVDCSGSMSVTKDQLTALIVRTAAKTIALYAGQPGDQSGLLFVIAQNGRFSEIENATSQFGSGNIIDGPALEWLSRQPAPRMWVSDGNVTGRGDEWASRLTEQVEAAVWAARIKRIASMDDLLSRDGAKHSGTLAAPVHPAGK